MFHPEKLFHHSTEQRLKQFMKEGSELFTWAIRVISMKSELYNILEVILLPMWHEYDCKKVGINL